MINVNCLGLLYCTHAALPVMREAGGGDIVNVASVAGRQASSGSGVYNMTKFGVVAFTEGLRQEALHIGIRATVVEPGMVATELLDHNENPVVLEAAAKMQEQIGDAAPGRGHRPGDPLRRLPAAARRRQRGARPADRQQR